MSVSYMMAACYGPFPKDTKVAPIVTG